MIYLPLIEDLETYKINQIYRKTSLSQQLFERKQTILNRKASVDYFLKNDESFYENFWDFKAFKEDFKEKEESKGIQSLENIENIENLEWRNPSSNNKVNMSDQFIINSPINENNFSGDASNANIENPKILEFLVETESRQGDSESRNSFNNEGNQIKEFSLLKHSLMNNIYKNKSIIKIHPVPIENLRKNSTEKKIQMEIEKKEEAEMKFSKMFESQEKKIQEIKKKDSQKEINLSMVSSKMLSSNFSPEKKFSSSDLDNFSLKHNMKSSFFKTDKELSKPVFFDNYENTEDLMKKVVFL